MYSLLEADESIIQIFDTQDKSNDEVEFNPGSNTIWWDSESAINLNGVDRSPASRLVHEAGHALWYNYSDETKEQLIKDRMSSPNDPAMTDAHEEKVINWIENIISVEIGEQPRSCHTCRIIRSKVSSPLQSKPKKKN